MFARSTGTQPLPGYEGVDVGMPMDRVVVAVVLAAVPPAVKNQSLQKVVPGNVHIPVLLTVENVEVPILI